MAVPLWLRAGSTILFVAVSLGIGARPAEPAQRYALLVGVSEYSHAKRLGLEPLEGPRNDVRLMRDVLLKRGFAPEGITVLADGVEGGEDPTYANITAAFKELEDELRHTGGEDDFVVIYLSGHGLSQRDQNGDEADNYDEVFLPRDVDEDPTSEPRLIKNALVDDEIGGAVTALRKLGADVWLIIDSCYSGTGVRAGNPRVRSRVASHAKFGIDAPGAVPIEEKTDAVAGVDDLGPGAGGLMAFYAAQSSEQAKEVDFSEDRARQEWYGIFTAKLANRLEQGGNLTYRLLFQSVLHDINSHGNAGLRGVVQTPLWEGTMADSIPGLPERGSGLQQFAIYGEELQAGLVHGVSERAVLAVVADPLDPDEKSLGYVQVRTVEPLTSYVEPVERACAEETRNAQCPRAAGPKFLDDANFARLQSVPVDLALRLSAPFDLDCPAKPDGPLAIAREGAGSCKPGEHAPLFAALNTIAAMPAEELGLTVILNAEQYDVAIGFKEDRIWFGDEIGFSSPAGDGRPANLAWPRERPDGSAADGEYDPAELEGMIRAMGRAFNISALAEALRGAGAENIRRPSPVKIVARLQEASHEMLAEPQTENRQRECDVLEAQGGLSSERELPQPANLNQCDVLTLKAAGTHGQKYDVNVIYIDANFGIEVTTALVDGPGEASLKGWRICSECPVRYGSIETQSVLGSEVAYVIISKQRENGEPLSLKHLSQPRLREALRGVKGGAPDPLSHLINSFAEPGATTRAMPPRVPDEVWIETIRWRVWPRDAVISNKVLVN